MRPGARGWLVIAVVAVATIGEGGAAAGPLLAQHLLLAAAVALSAIVLPPPARVPSRRPAVAWLVFVVLAAAGAVTAPYAYAAWLVFVEILAFGALAWLACGGSEALAGALPTSVACLAAAHAVVAVVQRSSGLARPASTFLNPNHLAAWLGASVLLLAGRVSDDTASRSSRQLASLASAGALAGIFVTGSRGALVGLAAGAAAFVATSWAGLTARARRAMVAFAVVALLAVGAGVVARFASENDPYSFHRTRIWTASLGAVVGSPWSGTGPGQFAAAAANLNFPLDEAKLRFERGFRTPHSDVLRAICEFGIPAGLAVFVAAGLVAWEFIRRPAHASPIERGAFAALVSLAMQSCVDDLTTRPAIVLLGAALVGLLVARRRETPQSKSARAGAVAIAVGLVAALGVGEVAGYVAWNAAGTLPRGRLDGSQLARLQRALAWNPMQPDSWERLAEHVVGDGTIASVYDYASAREAAEHARRLQPADATYARGAARVEANACLSIFPFAATRDRAAALYAQALELSRTDATIPLETAKFLLRAGDAKGARRAAEQALRIEPRAAVPRLWLARAILRDEGDRGKSKARRLVEEVPALALREGDVPTSSYDAALRSVDRGMLDALRRETE